MSLTRRRERWFYLLISPWLAGFLLLQLGPLIGAFLLSFADWPLPQPPKFVGLAHFGELTGDPLLLRSLANTLYYAAGTVPVGLGLGLILALLLGRKRRGAGLFRAIFFLPVIVSGVATTFLWGWIFNPRYGVVNQVLGMIGIHGPGWFFDEHWAMPALILMSLWNVGVNMVVYLAALQNVPAELHEAAVLDGAGWWPRLWRITLPMISPATFYLMVINLIGAFHVFTPAYLLTRGGPNNATLTLPLYIYLNAFSWGRLGYASTVAFLSLSVILALTLLQFAAAKRWVFYAGDETGS